MTIEEKKVNDTIRTQTNQTSLSESNMLLFKVMLPDSCSKPTTNGPRLAYYSHQCVPSHDNLLHWSATFSGTSRKHTSSTTTSAVTISRIPAPATATTTTVSRHFRKFVINGLIGFAKDIDEFPRLSGIVTGKQCNCSSFRSSTTGPTDSMDVIFVIVWKIVIDNCLDVLYVCDN